MAFLGSQTMTSTQNSLAEPASLAVPTRQHTASSRIGDEEDPYPNVFTTSEAKSNTTQSNLFYAMFKSPIGQRRKKRSMGRKMAGAQLTKEDKATHPALQVPRTIFMVPDLDDPKTLGTSGSSPMTRRTFAATTHETNSDVVESNKKSKFFASMRATKRGLHLRKQDRSHAPNAAAGRNETKTDDSCMDGGDAQNEPAAFESVSDLEWGNLEWGVVSNNSQDRLAMLLHQKATRRASHGGQSTCVNFDARQTSSVETGSRHPKVTRRLSCGPLVSNHMG